MNIFVAAWFYPPITSSEGIVTYKLLRKSKNHYDVFSSLSDNWSYHTEFSSYEEPNITNYAIDTDDIDKFVDACIYKFEELYPIRKYECIMTRSTPPESILVGLKIKELHPEVKWIASLADPVANNPYEIDTYIDNNPLLTKTQKNQYKGLLMSKDMSALAPLRKRSENGIKLLCKLKEWESEVMNKADLIICPTERQLSYLGGEGGWKSKYFTLPHSFCSDFYPETIQRKRENKIVFTYLGYSDVRRSLKPFVDAVNLLKREGSPAADIALFRFVGNTPREITDMVLNFDLQDQIRIEPSVDYFKSLGIMADSDWLLHVDAFFQGLNPGGSIFFAGKLADYMGAGKPILALTGDGSPACRIVKKAGGIRLAADDISAIADTIEGICLGYIEPKVNKKYTRIYESGNVAKRLDDKLDAMFARDYKPNKLGCHADTSKDEKILTICVPSYNVQRCLGRCLQTLTECKYTPYMDIIVVDDGSIDHTLDIAKNYEREYPGIVRAIHKENGGHGSTINTALEKAVGRYFRVVDSDDWIDSSELDKVLGRVLTCEIDTDIVSTNYHIVNLEHGTIWPIMQDYAVEYDSVLSFEEIDTDKAYFTMSGSMIKTSILKSMNMKLQENTFFVDVEFILFPIPYINTVMFVDAFIYKYSQGSTEQSVHIPNMVKRYDHHERVMKRVIEYRKSTQFSNAQAQYYDSILKRVLYTHYGLCLVYDHNKEEGYKRIGAFDRYLSETYPEMAKWIAKAMPVVKAARKANFEFAKVKRSPAYFASTSKNYAKGYLVNHKHLIKRLVKNRYTYAIATSRFFSEGKGLAFRNKVYKAMIG